MMDYKPILNKLEEPIFDAVEWLRDGCGQLSDQAHQYL